MVLIKRPGRAWRKSSMPGRGSLLLVAPCLYPPHPDHFGANSLNGAINA